MHARSRSVVRFALLAATVAGAARPAGAQAQCTVDETSPAQLNKALVAVTLAQQAQSGGKTADAEKQLQAAVKALTDAPEKIKNPLGRQLLLGRALALWASQPGVSHTPTRAALGYTANPTATIDLYAALDSTLTAVETAQPACASETTRLRAGQPWLTLINAAVERTNADAQDSAEVLARRSLLLYRGAPYAEMILGNIENKRGRTATALAHYGRAIAAAAADTTFAEQQRALMLTVANVTAGVADTAKGATKQQWSRDAAAAYDKLVAQFPGSQEARAASDRLATLRLALGDTSGVKAAYAAQLATPDKFTYGELLMAGVSASRAGQVADAQQLFEAAVKANPYNRDALYNAALLAHDRKEYPRSLALLARLADVDPGNDQGWLLFAHNYAALNKATKEPKQAKAYSDSLTKYLKRAQELPYQVRFTEWSSAAAKNTLRGRIQNKGAAAKSYTLTFEFLDATGQVVGTQPVTVSNVAPGAEGTFSAEASTKAIAYRYKVE
jgi:hypothetical protein